jgi:hypothetical protein
VGAVSVAWHFFLKDKCALAPSADVAVAGVAAAVDPPAARPAAQAVSGRAAGWGADGLVIEAANGIGADFEARGFPARAMTFAGREGVSDLVQDRVANLRFVVEQYQRPRKGNEPGPIPARPEAPPGVVETE